MNDLGIVHDWLSVEKWKHLLTDPRYIHKNQHSKFEKKEFENSFVIHKPKKTWNRKQKIECSRWDCAAINYDWRFKCKNCRFANKNQKQIAQDIYLWHSQG